MVRWMVRFSIQNRVFANLLMAGLIGLGIFSYSNMRLSLYPDVNHSWVNIFTDYPGAPPEVVEREVTNRIEDEVGEMEEVDFIISASLEDRSLVWIRLKTNVTDMERAEQDIRRKINGIDFADGVNKPDIQVTNYTVVPVLYLAISGDVEKQVLETAADILEKELKTISGLREIKLYGEYEREIHVEVDPVKLSGYGVTMEEVALSLRNNNKDIPGGEVKEGLERYSIRLNGIFRSVENIRNLYVTSFSGPGAGTGGRVRIRDVADVRDLLKDRKIKTRFNRKNAIIMTALKGKKVDSVKLVKGICEVIERKNNVMPPGVSIKVFNDSSQDITRLIRILENNSVVGLILVLIILGIMIGWRQAFFAAIGIPVSFSGALIFLYFMDYSLNQISLFGMILAIGMIVDDSIVVIENVYSRLEKGVLPETGVQEGVSEIAVPVFASSLTTVAAFLPVLLLGPPMGRIIRQVPIVITVILATSLLECFLVLPSHLADFATPSRHSIHIGRLIKRTAVRIAKFIMRRGGLFLAAALLMTVGAVVYIGLHGRELFSNEDLRGFRIGIEMRPGTKLEETYRMVNKCADTVIARYGEDFDVVASYAGVLEQDVFGIMVVRDSNVGQILVEIKENAPESISYYIDRLKKDLKVIPGMYKEPNFIKFENAPILTNDVEVVIRADNFDVLEEAAESFKAMLRTIPGVVEIDDNLSTVKDQVQIRVQDRRAAKYGLTRTMIGYEVYRAFQGEKVGVFHKKDKDVDIVLKLQEEFRQTGTDLKNLTIPTPDGKQVKLCDVARIETVTGRTVIAHTDNRRAVAVTGRVDRNVTTQYAVNQKLTRLFPEFERRFTGCTFDHQGANDDMEESFAQLKWIMLLALFCVYFILGTQFQSFVKPILVMMAIPFSLTGVACSMIIGENPLSLLIFVGIIGLSGVVVNDSLILIDFMNRQLDSGHSRAYILLKGVASRARPVLFTSLTTIAGLIPAATGLCGKSKVWQPLAQTFIGGLVMSTFTTLFLLPVMYSILTRKRTDSGGEEK